MTIPKMGSCSSVVSTAYRDSRKQHRFEELLVGVRAVDTWYFLDISPLSLRPSRIGYTIEIIDVVVHELHTIDLFTRPSLCTMIDCGEFSRAWLVLYRRGWCYLAHVLAK